MTRIGFAYNQKPEPAAPRVADDADAPLPDEEPPSRRRDRWSRPSAETAPAGVVAAPPAPATHWAPDDEFAEWDDEETIVAVERVLRRLGQVIRLEANADFPERLRSTRPDIVFNMAEGLRGVNREAHVPAICEFFGIPYSGSDPFTLALCLDKARTKEMLAYHGVPTAPFTVVRNEAELEGLVGGTRDSGLPLFVKPLHEGSSKVVTEQN